MSFIEHLEALRWHIVRSVLAIVILAILTLGALAALHWYQKRSARAEGNIEGAPFIVRQSRQYSTLASSALSSYSEAVWK